MNVELDDIEHRRQEDARLLRMENKLSAINVKINNGLSTRSKETAKSVKVLEKSHHDMEKMFASHVTECDLIKGTVTEIKKSLDTIITVQNNWIKLYNRGLLFLLFSLCSAGVWVFSNIDEIDTFMDQIESITSDHTEFMASQPTTIFEEQLSPKFQFSDNDDGKFTILNDLLELRPPSVGEETQID